MPEPDCIFCRILAGELPATVVAQDERTFSFMDINPATRGHMLVIPRAHSRDITEIAPEDLAACNASAQALVGRALDRLGADGVNVLNACRPAAGQTVFHTHLHVIPRYRDDPLKLPWLPRGAEGDQIARTAAMIRNGGGDG